MTPAVDIPGLLAGFDQRGERLALSFYKGKTPSGRLTYAELGARVDALAAALHAERGVRAGDRIALLSPNRLEIPVLVLALLRLGAVVVPLNPASTPEDWSYMLGHSRARGLCVTRELAALVPAAVARELLWPIEDLFELRKSDPPPPAPELAEAVGVVLYTSGTTGNPKGVALRQRNLLANARSLATHFELDGTPQLAVLPLYHAHAFGFGLMTALTTGGHLVFTDRLEPFTWAAVVRAEAIAVSSVVPTLLPMLLAAGASKTALPTLRHLLVSSAPLSIPAARDFEARTGIPLVHGWGQSEYTNFACCLSPKLSPDQRERLMFGEEVPSVGPALEGTEVRVVDPSGDPVGEGQRGELQIRGHSTMQGYLDDPEATARALSAQGWLSSGDEGFFRLSAGRPNFFVSGRLKEIIIRDAEKYSPVRLERALLETLPELSGLLVVVGFPHAEHGEEIGAYVQLERMDEPLRERLTAAIQTLPVAERPKVVLHGPAAIPRTHTGKIQRLKLQPWFAAWNAHRGPLVVAARLSS